jgi:osmoprotectant transport system substrate-binding protein
VTPRPTHARRASERPTHARRASERPTHAGPSPARRRLPVRPAVAAVAVTMVLALMGCTAGSRTPPARSGPRPVVVASFNFPESVLLAQLYGQALRGRGYPVEIQPNAGTREILDPALSKGLVDLVPEYAGSALAFLTLGATLPSPYVAETYRSLASAVAPYGVTAMTPSPARDANAFVVTATTASAYGLQDLSDLARVGPKLVFGGPPECVTRPLCLPGLRRAYGVRFGTVVPLDAGGPLTLQALRSGGIDVALMFTTDPNIDGDGLVVLVDDRKLQPADNVTPMIRRAVLARFGPGLATTVDAVSRALTTDDLRSLVGEVTLRGRSPAEVAARWLADRGIG